MKQILLTIALLTGLQSLSAQNNLPKWISTNLKPGEAIGYGMNRETALQDAIGQLYDRFTMTVDSTSLLSTLKQMDSTLVVDQRSAWVVSAMGNETFLIKDTLQQDSLYWMHVVVKADELQTFVEQQRMTKMMQGSEYLIRAHICREQGDVLAAVHEYARGLNEILPCMHKHMTSEMLEGRDLGVTLLNEYLTAFDGIALKARYDSLPAVAGEDLPVPLSFSLTIQDKPLVNFPVEGWIEEGSMSADSKSDAQGKVWLHVKKAPQKQGLSAGIVVNRGLLATLDETYAKPLLLQHLDKGFPQAQTRLVLFDPAPTFYIALDSLDREHADSLAVVLTRQGMKQVEEKTGADLICTLTYQGQRNAAQKRGNYMLASTQCALTVSVQVQETGAVLGTYSISDFVLAHPAMKSDNDVRVRAMQLMMRRASDEMPAQLGKLKYDKRSVVYGKVAKR